MGRKNELASHLSVLPPATANPASPSRFLDAASAGIGDGSQAIDAGLSKRRKAQRYRDLTCPRTRTSRLADGTRIVTVGSHVLVYPATGSVEEGAKKHPKNSSAAAGAVTTFEEHPLFGFPDDSIKHYSLGVGLYFKGLRFLAYIFAACAVLTLPTVILAVMSNPGNGSSSGMYFEKTTVGNFGSRLTTNSTAELTWGSDLANAFSRGQLVLLISSLDAAVCVLLLAFCVWLSHRQTTEARAYSKREITVKKYSVEVVGLPKHYHDRFKLAMWFQDRFGPVVDCAIAFDQHDLLDLYRSRGTTRKDIDMAVTHGESARLDQLYESLAKIDNRIHLVQQDLAHRRTLGAYVTFESQASRIACEKAFSNYWIKSLAGKLKSSTSPDGTTATGPAKGVNTSKSLLFGKGQHVLRVRQAPEPSNILFKNLKYTRRQKLVRRALTFVATGVIIFLSVGVVYLAQRFQNDSTDSSNEECSTLDNSCAIARGLSVLSAVTIVVVNLILKLVTKSLTKFEKHHSLTRMQESITNKLFVGLFLNTAVVLLIVNTYFKSNVSQFGLSIAFDGIYTDFDYEWAVHVGASIILTMVLNTVNPHLLPFMMVPWRKWRRNTCCVPSRHQPQSVWNARYAGEEFELAERYAVLLNTLFVTLLYAGGMPLLVPIAALTFALTYLMDRVSFLRLYRIPPRFDQSLAMYTTTLLPYAIFMHLAFTMWFLSAPILHETHLEVGQSGASGDYSASGWTTRLLRWSTLPVLVLLLLVAAYLLVFRLGRSAMRACMDVDETAEVGGDSSKFVPYSVARRTVTLETYHPHGSPYYHDAFIRTPSRKMMKIPTPLHVLQDQARAAAQARQQAMVQKYAAAAKATPTVVADLPAAAEDEIDERPGSRAASMGIDAKRDMRATPEAFTRMRDAAKRVAYSRQATISGSRQDDYLPPAVVKPSSTKTTTTPLPEVRKKKKVQVGGRERVQLRDGDPAQQPPAPSQQPSGTKQPAAPIVVLDIADETAAHVQHEVDQALQSPELADDAGRDEAAALLPSDSRFASHLQHHASISMPTQDPLLESVRSQLHRMSSAMHGEEAAPGAVNQSRRKSSRRRTARSKEHREADRERRSRPKRSKPASVHDSSSVPTLGEEVAIRLPQEAVSDEPADASTSASDRSVSAPESAQLVPTACPNDQCGRVLELVDTGVPQLYQCPFCDTGFIM